MDTKRYEETVHVNRCLLPKKAVYGAQLYMCIGIVHVLSVWLVFVAAFSFGFTQFFF